MIETITPIAQCPSCGTAMEIVFDAERPAGEHRTYVQVGALQISQPAATTISDMDYSRFRNERTAARLAYERWLQEDAQPFAANNERSEVQLLDAVMPAPFIEQLLPFLACVAVILGFIALGSQEPITYSVIVLNPLLVSLYLHRRSQRRQKARELVDSRSQRRATFQYSTRQSLEESWRGAVA